jgi:hypothetical protein
VLRSSRQGDVAFVAGLMIGVIALFAFGSIEHRTLVLSTSDFSGVWAGARAIVVGSDPYDPNSWIRTAAELGTKPPDTIVYAYPPWVAIALIPLGILPLPIASAVWTGAGLIVAAVAVRALLRTAVPGLPLVHGLSGLALLASEAGLGTFTGGQWTYLLLAASIGVYLLHATHPRLAGVLALSALAKPQLFPFALWSWVRAAYARTGRLTFAFAALGGMATIVAATVLVAPRWIESWLMNALQVRVTDPTTPTLSAAYAGVVGDLGPLAAVVTLLVAVALALRFDPSEKAWWSVWPVMSLLGATYTHAYDQLLLLPPLIVSTGLVAERSRHSAIRFVALWGFLLLPVSLVLKGVGELRGSESYTILLTAAVFILVIAIHRPSRRSALAGPAPSAAP